MFGKKMYPAPEENLVDQAAFKNMGGKIKDIKVQGEESIKNEIAVFLC